MTQEQRPLKEAKDVVAVEIETSCQMLEVAPCWMLQKEEIEKLGYA